jgi:hypothetical protein
MEPRGLCICLVLLCGLSATAMSMSAPEHGAQRLPLSAPSPETIASDDKAGWTWAGIEEEDDADALAKARFSPKHKKHHRHDLHQHLSKQPHNRTGEQWSGVLWALLQPVDAAAAWSDRGWCRRQLPQSMRTWLRAARQLQL